MATIALPFGRDPLAELLRHADVRLDAAVTKLGDRRDLDDVTFEVMAARMLVETAQVRVELGNHRMCPICGWGTA